MMFVASRKSKAKIFHEEHCPYARRISEENRMYFATADDALRAGYSPCRHCSAVFRAFRREREEIYAYCAANGVQIFTSKHRLYIRTPRSAWIVAPGERQALRLFHKNEENRPSNALETRYTGYHEQKAGGRTILSLLEYIVRHDAYRRLHPCFQRPLPTPPPRKGTKRYKKWMKADKSRARRHEIGNVLSLIEGLPN